MNANMFNNYYSFNANDTFKNKRLSRTGNMFSQRLPLTCIIKINRT